MGRLDRESVHAHLVSVEEAVAVLRGAATWTAADRFAAFASDVRAFLDINPEL